MFSVLLDMDKILGVNTILCVPDMFEQYLMMFGAQMRILVFMWF